MFQNVIGYVKTRFQRPAQLLFGAVQFFFARGLAVRLSGILAGGQAKPDVGVAQDQGWARVEFGLADGLVDGFHVIAILDVLGMPAIGVKRGRRGLR